MVPRQVPMKSLSAFAIAARRSSFLLAAQDLNISPSAISYHVKVLEEHLGITLFERAGNGVALTRTGRKYLNMVQPALSQIEEAGLLLNDVGEETLNIRVAISFLVQWLLPNLADFKASNPSIQLEIDTRRSFGDFTSAPLDAEIRFGTSIPGDYHVEPLMVENIMPMCSPDLAATISCPSDLKRLRLIHSQRSIISWPMWLGAYGVVRQPDADDLWFDRAFLALHAATQGLGLALEGDFLAGEDLSAGRLVVPFSVQRDEFRVCRHYWAFPHQNSGVHRLRVFQEWLFDRLAKDIADRAI